LSRFGVETEQDTITILSLVCIDDLANLVRIGPRFFRNTRDSIAAAPKTDKKSVVNHQ